MVQTLVDVAEEFRGAELQLATSSAVTRCLDVAGPNGAIRVR